MGRENIIPLSELRMKDTARAGGKNASLGELIGALSAAGVRVPGGFAVAADVYRRFLDDNNLRDYIQNAVAALDTDDTAALSDTAAEIRRRILESPLPADAESEIRAAYGKMGEDAAVAVRSSATAEDMPDASFAGQQETFLNIRGADAVIDSVRRVFASLFTARAVSYRRRRGYETPDVALSAAVQKMVRSDLAASGVMFTLDTESGFADAVFITAAYGLGETVVQGAVNPDEFYVYKPALRAGCANPVIRRRLGEKADKMILGDSGEAGNSVKNVRVEESARRQFCIGDEDIKTLARYALLIEEHYGRHMDIEWAKDGESGEVFIVQARPETVKSRAALSFSRYRVIAKGRKIAEGRAIGQKIGIGIARRTDGPQDMERIGEGDVLVADMTDPDWEPVMKRAAAIVTRRGGRTCHAAIIARELGVPAIVGCGESFAAIEDGMEISVCCAEGDAGSIYEGRMEFEIDEFSPETAGEAPVKLQINIANPDLAFEFSRLPADGVGLARLEFIIARTIGFHPRCALEYARLPSELQREVRRLSAGYDSPQACYVGKIAEGAATIAAAFAPRPVIVRLSDFKSNEYAGLAGGRRFEPSEENPMLGFRGAARYLDAAFRDCFALECEAMKHTRESMGIENIWLMIPFVRTVAEAKAVIAVLGENGISRDSWTIIMMCEVPANALLAEEFLEHFDGFSIGSNDLTQLTLALDRDSELVSGIFDERNPAVKMMISRAIRACREQGKYAGICGQAPSDHPELARWLVEEGISAISLNPDTLMETRMRLAASG
ncbi:MAG: phosphoenolpyruvate synthase [Gammaproteobacteria bacterium]